MGRMLKINQEDMANQIGVLTPAWGPITVGEYFNRNLANEGNQLAAFIMIGVGSPNDTGDLVTEDSNGIISVVQACPTGALIPVAKCARIIESATIDGVSYTTGCDKMTWFGGAS